MNVKTILMSIQLVLLLSIAPGLQAGDVTQYLGGASHSGDDSPEAARLDSLSDLSLCYELTALAGRTFADPLVFDNSLILVSDSGSVLCLSLDSGDMRWNVELGARVTATPALSNNRVLVASEKGFVVALDLANGNELWRFIHGGIQTAAPVVDGDQVIVSPGVGSSKLYALNVKDGSIAWSADLSRYAQSPPAVADGKVIVAQPDGSLSAYSRVDGSSLWTASFTTSSLYYGVAPVIARHPITGTYYAYIMPGGSLVQTGSSITGYRGYLAYKVNLSNGQAETIVPGRSGPPLAASTREGAPIDEGISNEPLFQLQAPADLLEQLKGITHLSTQLEVIERYEEQNGVELDDVKQQLQEFARVRLAQSERAKHKASLAKSEGEGSGFPSSVFDSLWPTSGSARPGVTSYLARGSEEFVCIVMREDPSQSIKPRTMVFSIDGSTGGEVRWHYASETFSHVGLPRAQSSMFIPKSSDTDGAYLVVPLGNHIAVFDAGGSNAPLFTIEMPNTVFPTPVIANGYFVALDSYGHIKVYKVLSNARPNAPSILSPADKADIRAGTSATVSWSAPGDDSTLAANMRYRLQYSLDDGLSTESGTVEVAVGVTSYSFDELEADTSISFSLQAIDENNSLSTASAERTFTFYKDLTPPGPVKNLKAIAGPLSIRIEYEKSNDHAPSGAEDVARYLVTVVDQGSGSSFEVDAGLDQLLTIEGHNPATPLTSTSTYSVSVIAIDARGNRSNQSVTASSPLEAGSEDSFAPLLIGAVLRDSAGKGRIDRVDLLFNEAISAQGLNVSGFSLDGQAATGYSNLSGSTLSLHFGVGVEGTGVLQLTYDPAIGEVTDLAGNAMSAVNESMVNEVDSANPVVLTSSLIAIDQNGDGVPDLIRGAFSETIASGSLELGDLKSIKDHHGQALIATAITLLPDSRSFEILLSGDQGAMGAPQVQFADDGSGLFIEDASGNSLISESSNLAPEIAFVQGLGSRFVQPGVVKIDASPTADPDGDRAKLNYQWRVETLGAGAAPVFLANGQSVVNGQNLNVVQLLASESGSFAIRLIVTDEGGQASEKLVVLTVQNVTPVLPEFDDLYVALDSGAIWLDGRITTDPNSAESYQDISDYEWTYEGGVEAAVVEIDNANEALASVDTTDLQAGTYDFSLRVRDNYGAMTSKSLRVYLYDDTNLPPQAVAGPDRHWLAGRSLKLDGRFSQDDNKLELTYLWESLTPSVVISNPDQAVATITPVSAGNYGFKLTVSDGQFEHNDEIWIDVFEPSLEHAPTLATSSPSSVTVGEPFGVSLLGSSDLDDDSLTYEWIPVSGPQLSQVSTTSSGALQTMVARVPGVARYLVVASDGELESLTRSLEIRVLPSSENAPSLSVEPIEWAELGTQVSVSCAATSGQAGTGASFIVEQLDGWKACDLNVTEEGFTFTPEASGDYRFAVRAYDGVAFSESEELTIAVSAIETDLPFATPAISDSRIEQSESAVVNLIAGNPTSSLETQPSFLWIQTEGPTATLLEPNAATCAVDVPNKAGDYRFELYVEDGSVRRNMGGVSLTVDPATSISAGNPAISGGSCSMNSQRYFTVALLLLMTVVALLVSSRRSRKGPVAAGSE